MTVHVQGTPVQDTMICLWCFILTVVAIGGSVLVARSATSVVSATRVAHDETRVELAECRKQVNSAAINSATN